MLARAPRRTDASGWSVAAHLGTIVVVVLLACIAAGFYSGKQTLDTARSNVRANATSLAGVAAQDVQEAVGVARAQIGQLAVNPGVGQALVDPAGCQLTFALDLGEKSHLDLIRPDGVIVCSSRPES